MNKIAGLLAAALALSLAGCAGQAVVDHEPLTVRIVTIQQDGPLAVGGGLLLVRAAAGGGTGPVRYALWSQKEGLPLLEESSSTPSWQWRPKMPGTYRLQVVAMDKEGEQVASDWSVQYDFGPGLDDRTLVAVLPLDNISGGSAPLADIHLALRGHLAAAGLRLMEPESLAAFMKRHRMRHTGGLSAELAAALRQEAGVEAVFITALESWQERGEPRVAMLARLVLTTPGPEIAWMDSVGVAGHERPGLLGLGRLTSTEAVLNKALEELTASLGRYMEGQHRSYRPALSLRGSDSQEIQVLDELVSADLSGPNPKGGHGPRTSYRFSGFEPRRPYSVAVVPFLNIEARPNAGVVMALHFVKELHRYENLRVIEPGVVRHTLLKYRMIMEAGPSLAVSDVLASDAILGADLVLSGKVFDYQGETGTSKVDFSAQMFDGPERQVVWNSRSYASGDDRVYFFNVGRIAAAHGLASRMTSLVCKKFMQH